MINKMEKSIIRLDNVWKVYTMGAVEVPALRGLNLDIKSGEFVSVMGPSGSGKSTAMNMIGCLDIPSKGHVFLDGKDISRLSESDLAQIRGKKIGFIFQQFNLIPTLTALENVMLPMTFQGIPLAVRRKKAEDLLKLVELEARMNHKPSEMSGGQQQRVAIARALSNDPDVILADEPTGNLDSHSGTNVMDFLKKLNKEQKKTIVMVTHDEDVAHHACRIEYLKDGQIIKTIKGNMGYCPSEDKKQVQKAITSKSKDLKVKSVRDRI
jgi:putative ABC transport system ATP-binding protein